MLAYATDEAAQHGLTIGEVVWVPGSMEVPLALDRLLPSHDAAACLGDNRAHRDSLLSSIGCLRAMLSAMQAFFISTLYKICREGILLFMVSTSRI